MESFGENVFTFEKKQNRNKKKLKMFHEKMHHKYYK